MPLKSGRLTPRENRFAEAFAKTGDGAYALAKAGLAVQAGAERMLRREGVRDRIAAIREERAARIVELTYDRLEDLLQPGRSMRDADLLSAIDKGAKIGHQYQPNAAGEVPVEERDAAAIAAAANATLGHLVELVERRPGEFAPAPAAPEPGPEQGIFG